MSDFVGFFIVTAGAFVTVSIAFITFNVIKIRSALENRNERERDKWRI